MNLVTFEQLLIRQYHFLSFFSFLPSANNPTEEAPPVNQNTGSLDVGC